MTTCPGCGAEVSESAKSCPECGRRLKVELDDIRKMRVGPPGILGDVKEDAATRKEAMERETEERKAAVQAKRKWPAWVWVVNLILVAGVVISSWVWVPDDFGILPSALIVGVVGGTVVGVFMGLVALIMKRESGTDGRGDGG
ncbi:hypothetical protein ES703_09491 [subsurface metagenome]